MGDDTETCLLILMALSEAYALVHFPKVIIHTMIHFLECDRNEITITPPQATCLVVLDTDRGNFSLIIALLLFPSASFSRAKVSNRSGRRDRSSKSGLPRLIVTYSNPRMGSFQVFRCRQRFSLSFRNAWILLSIIVNYPLSGGSCNSCPSM